MSHIHQSVLFYLSVLKDIFFKACDIISITRTTSRMTTFKTVRESSENKTNIQIKFDPIKYQGCWNQDQAPNPKWPLLFL